MVEIKWQSYLINENFKATFLIKFFDLGHLKRGEKKCFFLKKSGYFFQTKKLQISL
jgi:hypothetical protein